MVRVAAVAPEIAPIPPAFSTPGPSHAPESSSFWTETLTLAGPGDTLAAGAAQVIARDEPTAIGVRNLGTVDLVVVGAPANDRPEGLSGPGTARVPSGVFTVLYLPCRWHSFYGRPGECVEITRYLHDVQPVTVYGARRYFPVDLGEVLVSGTAYTSPWGTPVVYGGFAARELSGTDEAVFRVRDGGASGTVLEDISLSPQQSSSDQGTDALCASATLYVERVSGTFELGLRVN